MEKSKKSLLYRRIRSLHRDFGFFVIGLTVIYAISGIMLTYRDTSFLKSETLIEKSVSPGLTGGQLSRALHLKDFQVLSEDELTINFTGGNYNKQTGIATYTGMELPLLLQKLNNLHFVSSKDSRHWFTALYAVSLLFLALSSFWMYRPGTRYFKRGVITAASGAVASVLLIILQ